MTEPRYCPQCGAELPSDAPDGVCPKCVLKMGLGSEPGISSDAPIQTTTAYPPSFVPPAPADLAKYFPKLEILELLGQGGMGAVYKARQPGLDRLVALKILPPEAGRDPAFSERFTREARALAKLTHANIVAVHEFGQTDGLYYFVMEYVDGLNLRQLERSGRLTPPEALKIVPQICAALQFAHDEGIVHRDIKPENILLDRRGRVKIADYGLAKLLGREPTNFALTGARQVMGTPHYMAPEQIERPLEVDHRADIYSLGVVFYEMLTGELPLGKFAPPSHKVHVDVRLDEVVLRAMEKEPERRYQHASEVKTTVETIGSSPAAPLLKQPAPERPPGLPWYFVLGATAVFLLGWLFAGAMWNFRNPGLIVALVVMLGLGYGIARWALTVVPALRAELDQRGWVRWSVQNVFAVALFTFAFSGMFASVFMSWYEEDMENAPQPTRTGNYHLLLKPLRAYQAQLPRQDLYMMGGISMGPAKDRFGKWVPVVACLAVLASAAVFLDTRRYRESWANHWKPSLALALPVLAGFGVAYFGVSYRGQGGHWNAGRNIITLHCNADLNRVMDVLEQWMEKHGYERGWERTEGKDWRHRPSGSGEWFSRLTLVQESAGRVKELAEYGNFEVRQRPPFDYYRMTWWGLRRPKPHFSIECVSSLAPPTETVVKIQDISYRFPSHELEDWQLFLDELVAALNDVRMK